MTINVVVVGGGQNCEHEVSLASAAGVADALNRYTYDVLELTIAPGGVWHGQSGPLAATPAKSLAVALMLMSECDVAIPMVHGPHGEDGTLAALFDLAGLPYVGSGVRAGALAMDKHATKLVAGSLGIRTAAGVVVTEPTRLTWLDPVVVKPVSAGSSHGVRLVTEPDQLPAAVEHALTLDDRVLIEEVLVGREIDIAVLQDADGTLTVGPPLEIGAQDGPLDIQAPGNRIFDTERKYGGGADFCIPAELTDVETKELSGAARALFDALGCQGLARFDFFLTEDGLVLNEVNTTPGLTEQSQVPRMFAAAGLAYSELIEKLVESAIGPVRPGRPSPAAART